MLLWVFFQVLNQDFFFKIQLERSRGIRLVRCHVYFMQHNRLFSHNDQLNIIYKCSSLSSVFNFFLLSFFPWWNRRVIWFRYSCITNVISLGFVFLKYLKNKWDKQQLSFFLIWCRINEKWFCHLLSLNNYN